jgi:hypothetical protein
VRLCGRFGPQGILIAHAMAAQTAIQTRARNIEVEKLARHRQQVIQRQQQHPAQLNHNGFLRSVQQGSKSAILKAQPACCTGELNPRSEVNNLFLDYIKPRIASEFAAWSERLTSLWFRCKVYHDADIAFSMTRLNMFVMDHSIGRFILATDNSFIRFDKGSPCR